MMETGRYYGVGDSLPALGERKITRPHLYSLIASAFPRHDPIHRRLDFINEPMFYWLGEKRKKVTVYATSEEIATRLDTICDILTGLSSRTDDRRPVFSVAGAYRAFSVIACNWLSIHGCLGADGHGRATVQLLPITLALAGYPNEFIPAEFQTAPKTYDMNRSLFALGYLNFHMRDGARIVAAETELNAKGVIHPLLLNRAIIGNPETRRNADRYATDVIARKYLRL